MSQVWRRSEVRNHKRRSLNTRLSSGTSANTSCTSRNAPGRMIRSDLFWYGNNPKVKPTYREKNLLDYLFGGFMSTLKRFGGCWYSFCENVTFFFFSIPPSIFGANFESEHAILKIARQRSGNQCCSQDARGGGTRRPAGALAGEPYWQARKTLSSTSRSQ